MGSTASEVPAGIAAPESTQSEAATPEQAAENAEAESTAYSQTVPDTLLPAGDTVLPYDEIRMIAHDTYTGTVPADGYYTMSKNDLWGLMRTDGTEVLPCASTGEFTQCQVPGRHWHTWILQGLSALSADELSARLTKEDGVLCVEHGGSHYAGFYYDAATQKTYSNKGSDGPGTAALVTDEDFECFGTALPCRLATYDPDRDKEYPETCFWDIGDLVYVRQDGSLLNNEVYRQAATFADRDVTYARQDGQLWLYLKADGTHLTEPIYWGIYGEDEKADTPATSHYGLSPLLNGYAAVCRDGKWGLLDATGSEYLPCEYAGTAWDGCTLWLKLNDGWHSYHIPGVEQTEAFSLTLPENITTPDYACQAGEFVYITTADGNLNLRAGPGTEYDKVGSIPPSTEVSACGFNYSETDLLGNWYLTEYNGQYGWVSAQYLRWKY